MENNNLATGEAYYNAFGSKNLAGMEPYLHPKVECIGPLSVISGKEAVLDTGKKLFTVFKGLTIRAKFSAGDKAMYVYDLDCPTPIGIFRVAALMAFKDNLITRIELFYDARPFEKKKEEIFSKQ